MSFLKYFYGLAVALVFTVQVGATNIPTQQANIELKGAGVELVTPNADCADAFCAK